MSENLDQSVEINRNDDSLNSSRNDVSSLKESNSSSQINFYSTSTPTLNKDDKLLDNHHDSGIANTSVQNSNPLNEKVASLASSVYTELEKIVKLYGRDTVKDLMQIQVNILEALDAEYQEKEEQIVENELLKDDYEKLLLQYEREKQARKDTELKLFQSEDSFAEQKREYEDKVTSLESIVRMIDLKSKNTTDHVQRLEEKETELKREYTKLHERYTELFKTHCDYMDRTKILFGNENRMESSSGASSTNVASSGNARFKLTQQTRSKNKPSDNSTPNQILDILASPSSNVNRTDLINAIKTSSRTDINAAINNLLSQELSQSESSVKQTTQSTVTNSEDNLDSISQNSSMTIADNGSVSSLASEKPKEQTDLNNKSPTEATDEYVSSQFSDIDFADSLGNISDEGNEAAEEAPAYNRLQSGENFDDIRANCVEFDDTASEYSNMNSMTQKEYDDEEEMSNRLKNDLSLFNELSRENYDITELDDGADLTGMSREVANLIRENSELLQTKHALNVLKDDLIVRLDNFSSEMVLLREELKNLQTIKACLQLRISELEEEAKKAKEDLAEKAKKQEEEDENVPISQRKRFTRAEMARVLMERNQYKERLMDLQEAVRWTEMMRASKIDPSALPGTANVTAIAPGPVIAKSSSGSVAALNDSASPTPEQQHQEHKKKTPLWKFFSDLFGSSSSSQAAAPTSPVHGSANVSSSSGSSNTTQTNSQVSPVAKKSSKNKHDIEVVNLNNKTVKAFEFLKEDQRQGEKKAQLQVKEEGRMQAYGWSLPSKSSLSLSNDSKNSSPITVPVPVYCRPLFEHDNNLKMSCSSTINYFFDTKCVKNAAELIEASPFSFLKSTSSNKSSVEHKSSCIWICNLNENDTHVSILDANKPGDLIEQFILKYLKVYCIQSISGASETEFPLSAEKLKNLSNNLNETNSILNEANQLDEASGEKKDSIENITFIEDNEQDTSSSTMNHPLSDSNDEVEVKNDQEKMLSSLYPTMWLGTQEGWLLVHSTISNVSKTIDKVKLKDAILSIIQNKGRVIVGLADGTIAIFHRNSEGLWDLKNFHLINVDKPAHSIRCLINVNETVWCGCRNKIFVLNPDEFKLLSTIEVHPRKENQVRHMAWINDGVWVSLRLDSTLRLYHAKTHQHLQYLDIEPFITRMLGTSNLGLSMIRISSLIIGVKRLWLGTGNGVILSLPFNEILKEGGNSANLSNITGTGIRPSDQPQTEIKGNIPYCNLSESQFSFHGHRNAIKFFLNVPVETIQKLSKTSVNDKVKLKEDSYEKVESMLILSGGHGYIDFRIGDSGKSSVDKSHEQRYDDIKADALESKTRSSSNKHERSHLIVWQLNSHNN